jgi:4-hydroxybenzoate polyprenyltransferase
VTRNAAATETVSGALPDAVPSQFLFKIAPASFRPYLQLARIDRPIGWWLLLLPCWQSSALAAGVEGKGLYFWHLLLFLIGAIVMRGAGSTYNDLVDREIDAKVERTRGRPLPSGRVSPEGAKLFLLAQALVGLAVLLSFNRFSIWLGLASLGFVAIYPFMKRVTSWPQAVLGLAFAYGGLMGWAAVFGALDWPAACSTRRRSSGPSATTRSTRCRTCATIPSPASSRRRGFSARTCGSASPPFIC